MIAGVAESHRNSDQGQQPEDEPRPRQKAMDELWANHESDEWSPGLRTLEERLYSSPGHWPCFCPGTIAEYDFISTKFNVDDTDKLGLSLSTSISTWTAKCTLPAHQNVALTATSNTIGDMLMIFFTSNLLLIISGIVIAPKEARQKQVHAEEEMAFTNTDPSGEFEYKIIRSETGAFKNPAKLRAALAEEARAGWDLLEKLDDVAASSINRLP